MVSFASGGKVGFIGFAVVKVVWSCRPTAYKNTELVNNTVVSDTTSKYNAATPEMPNSLIFSHDLAGGEWRHFF